MLNRKQIDEIVEKLNFGPMVRQYVDMVLRNYEEEDIVSIEKLEAISKVIEAEAQANQTQADNGFKNWENWKELIKN
jgi:DNA replication protein DnaD